MVKAASVFLVFSIVFSTVFPVAGQKARRSKVDPDSEVAPKLIETRSPQRKKSPSRLRKTEFGTIEAYSTGDGALLRWKMTAEVGNAGFVIFRVGAFGEQSISDFIPGASFRYPNQPIYGEDYVFFDAGGSPSALYYIEARADNGKTLRSSIVSVFNVKSLPQFDSPNRFDQSLLSPDSTATVKKFELSYPFDLRQEIAATAVDPNESRHREIISRPGTVRIGAKGSGIVRVTRSQLEAAGFNVNSDPSLWQLYLDGVERPLIIGPSASYIEFLGKELDTVESDIRMYYLTVGDQSGKRFASTFLRPAGGVITSPTYSQTFEFRERTIYANQVINGDEENFWGRVVGSSATTLTFNLSGIDPNSGDRPLFISFMGYSLTPHNINLVLNGNPLPPVTGTGRQSISREYIIPVSYLVEGTNTLQMVSNGASGDLSLFDRIRIDFPRYFKAISNRLDFYTDNYRAARLSGFSSPNIRVFDVTNEANERIVQNLTPVESAGTYGVTIPPTRGRRYLAVEASQVVTPLEVSAVNPALIGTPTQAAQFLVIAHRSLLQPASNWAAYRASQGISTKVIDVQEIFDEFNFGTSSSIAIKAFLDYAFHNWQVPPAYVLLIGDASYDPKNYTNNGYWNMVPTRMVNTLYSKTASDEALADFNNDGLAEIAIGRIASRDIAGVTNVFNKTVTWENSLGPNSMNRGALFAFDQPDGYDFEGMSDRIMSYLPSGMPKIRAQRGVPDNITAQTTVINAINAGQYILNYTGHGTSAAWRDTGFLWTGNVPQLTNASQPSLITALTCLNGYFIIPNSTDSFAEAFTKASNGGGVAIWASTGLTTPDVQEVMATQFYIQLSLGNINRLGDLITDAKAQLNTGGEVRYSWILIGDPMLRLH